MGNLYFLLCVFMSFSEYHILVLKSGKKFHQCRMEKFGVEKGRLLITENEIRVSSLSMEKEKNVIQVL